LARNIQAINHQRTKPDQQKGQALEKNKSNTLETLYYSKDLTDQQLSDQEKNELNEKLYQQYNVANLHDLDECLGKLCEKNLIRDYFGQFGDQHYVKYNCDRHSIHIINDTIESELFEDCLRKSNQARM
jgi:hypothetical protein